jgi:dihydroorotate dehydrogenase
VNDTSVTVGSRFAAEAFLTSLAANGVDYLLAQIEHANIRGVVGINIGKNKDTPAEQAVEELRYLSQG